MTKKTDSYFVSVANSNEAKPRIIKKTCIARYRQCSYLHNSGCLFLRLCHSIRLQLPTSTSTLIIYACSLEFEHFDNTWQSQEPYDLYLPLCSQCCGHLKLTYCVHAAY